MGLPEKDLAHLSGDIKRAMQWWFRNGCSTCGISRKPIRTYIPSRSEKTPLT